MMTWNFWAGAAFVTGVAVCGLVWLTGKPANLDVLEQPACGSLVSTADMQVSRAAHTATALPDGRVLVVGGFSEEEESPNGAEMYDPHRRKFFPMAPMVTPRHSHTVTLLPDGKVLIAGGYGKGSVMLAAAELYDPATNSFVQTGSLAAPRANHVAVLLHNGKVLLTGGEGPGWAMHSSAEVYDPATGKFSPTGSMTTARGGHVAVRLQDGRVLVVGGHNGRRGNLTILASAEIFDPATGVFSRTGDMSVRRHKHDGVLLGDGQVLVTGGSDEHDDRGVYNSTELFNPKTGRFVAGPVMKVGRYKHAGSSLLLPSGLVLIAGGAPQAETYDAVNRKFVLVSGEARLAGHFSAVALLRSGGVLITGGYGNDTGPRSSAWLYLP
ncbi:MAG: hypothetical protein K6U09_05720 [Acidobacteriia bacterium]|jgi:hypothetical protein|nr:hypothetical protein [Terriglobia bacterium]